MHPAFENAALGEGERERGGGRGRGGGGLRVGSTAPTLHNPRKDAVIHVRTCKKEAGSRSFYNHFSHLAIDNFSLGGICLR
jgi:hypothetical protein